MLCRRTRLTEQTGATNTDKRTATLKVTGLDRIASRKITLRTFFATLFFAFFGSASGAIIFVGDFPAVPPSYIPPLPAGSFLVPIEITGAVNQQTWQFDLLFDNMVVEVVDPQDGSAGIYGAEFTPDDANSLSFILGGFPFNSLGLVDDVAGSYPGLLDGVTGNGVLAFVLFDFLQGQQSNDPNIRIDGPPVTQVPEPATASLLAAGLLFVAYGRVRRFKARTMAWSRGALD